MIRGRSSRKHRAKQSKRDAYLRKVYEITETEYLALLAVSSGTCWICNQSPKPGRNLAVEHDHKLAKSLGVRRSIRGLACFMCNKRLIGRRRREHSWLYRRAAEYLDSDRAQDVLNGGAWVPKK